jgi:hypothetical protein
MRKIAFILSSLTLLCSVTVSADINTNAVLKEKGLVDQEGVNIPMKTDDQNNKWKVGYYDVKKGSPTLIEWIPSQEDIAKWSQLIQFQFFSFENNSLNPFNAEQFTQNFFKILKEQFPNIQTKIIEQSDNSVLLEWNLPSESNGEPPQIEIARIISTKNGLHRIAFTIKGTTIDSKTKEEWINRLKNITISASEAGASSAVTKPVLVPAKTANVAKKSSDKDESEDEEESDEEDEEEEEDDEEEKTKSSDKKVKAPAGK